jgi:CsoR family transcriptional regulator, copper-sensing transcriptional repressor
MNVVINETMKRDLESRLKRIKGQVEGIQTMVADERYCIDILTQITAVRRALEKVALKVMESHMDSCVSEAVRSHDGHRKIKELMKTIDHFVR